jgi:hypothetical protein
MIFSSHGGDINILAFFQVVASGQISPHFRGAKVVKFFDLQTFSEKNILRISPLSPFGRNRRTRLSYSERKENIKVLSILYKTIKI